MAQKCKADPELIMYGFYRRLNGGKFEFISFCQPEAAQMISVTKDDYEKIMAGLTPKP
jgi:hypothetical protein